MRNEEFRPTTRRRISNFEFPTDHPDWDFGFGIWDLGFPAAHPDRDFEFRFSDFEFPPARPGEDFGFGISNLGIPPARPVQLERGKVTNSKLKTRNSRLS
jgi:hypothetical protein